MAETKGVVPGRGGSFQVREAADVRGLQILRLGHMYHGTLAINQNFVRSITRCRQLRVIDLVDLEIDNGNSLVGIANGCPLLRKFSVRNLKLDEIDGVILDIVAEHCPRLTVLNLQDSQLCLSRDLTSESRPFHKLESMQFSCVHFENPRRLLQQDTIQSLVAEWRRVFPKLREIPFAEDIRSVRSMRMEGVDMNEDLEEDNVDEEMAGIFPELDFDDHDSVLRVLRVKLWKALGFGKDMEMHDKIEYMWQTNLEIEMLGWPVIPYEAFSEPTLHPTSAKSSL